MANNYLQQLSPELLAQLTSNRLAAPIAGADGNYYYGTSNQGGNSGADGTPTGFYGITPEIAGSNSGTFVVPTYDASGKQTGTREIKPDGSMSDLMGVLGVLGVAAGGALLGPEAAGAGAGAGGGELATGGFLGEAPWAATGGGALDFGAAGAAGAAGGVGGAGGGGALAGVGAPAAGGAAGGGGLSGLLGGSGMGWESLIGPVLGGLLGGQSTTSQQNTQKDLPEWLKPFVLGTNGQGGLLNDAQALYRQQAANGGLNDLQRAGMEAQRQFLTSPQYTAGYDQMRQQGMDLMGRGVAGNPFMGAQTGPGQGHPTPTPNPFGYSPNPTLMNALNPPSAPQSAPTQAAPTAQSIEQIVAEILKQQNATTNGGYSGGSSGGY